MLAFHRFLGSPTRSPSRQNRCDLFSAGAALFNGTIATGFNGHLDYYRQKELMAKQDAYNDENQEKQNAFNAEEAQKQRDWQADEWTRQFDAQNAYNTPFNQRQRLEEAGLNPYMTMSNGNPATPVSAPSVPAAAAASGNPLGVGLGHVNSVDFAKGVSDIAQALKSIAEAKKSKAETSNLEAMYKGILAESEFNAFVKSKDLSFVKQLNGRMSPQMQELLERINQIGSETARNESEAALATQKKETEAQITDLQEEAKKLKKREREVFDKYADMVKEHGDTRYQRELAQLRKDRASAYRDEQGAVSDRMQAGAAVQNADTNAFVGASHVRVNDDTREQIKKTVDLLKEQIKNAQNNNDWFTATRLSEIVRNLLGAGASAAGSAAGFIK